MDDRTQTAAQDILAMTELIRDTFPDDLPNLWCKLSPAIETIERNAHTIVNRAAILVTAE